MERFFSEKEYACMEALRLALINHARHQSTIKGKPITNTHLDKSFPKFERCAFQVEDFEKSLSTFWLRYGAHQQLDGIERFTLLKEWVGILYGNHALSKLSLDVLVNEISKQQIEANSDYRDGKEGAIKFIFPSPYEQAIEHALGMLGSYEEAFSVLGQ